jgi:phosphatidylserine/phosphatidylglycerophosphate/cardiolipin synthase-like enzyme/outer membrane protein OmpA-like peptidoglycan-associated protein
MRHELAFTPEPFSWPGEASWPGETGRDTAAYVRWVQSSLNRVSALRLAVDGMAGRTTRSAVRSFQQRSGLLVDGIVGPNTQAALIAAGAPRPPATATAAAAGSGSPVGVAPQCSVVGRSNCHDLYFDFDKDKPTPPAVNRPSRTDRDAHEDKLFEIAERVIYSWGTLQPINSLLILGHASPEGTEIYNHDLALRRADNVTEALAEHIDELEPGGGSRIDLQVESCGEAPSARTRAEDQRRVEVCIRPPPRWFETGGRGPTQMQPVWLGNAVRCFTDGAATFEDMVRSIRTAKAPDHYIYLLGWFLDDNFELITGDAGSTMHKLLVEAATSGVQIRAMLWDQKSGCPRLGDQVQNTAEVEHINRWLSTGAAILDNRTLNFGAHHQKVLIVKGSAGLAAYCGGIDINPDRIRQTGPTRGAPFHDVHCRIEGPAAHELLKVFRQRWQDHDPERTSLEGKCAAKLRARGLDPTRYCPLLGLSEPRPAWVGDMYVQIGRTYGNGAGHRFAPQGEQTALRMVLRAIGQARRFIYVEDQYLVSLQIRDALLAALQKTPQLIVIILIPHGSITDMALLACQVEVGEQVHYRRQQFIAPLRAAAANRVGVFFLSPPGARNTYVHSKMMVVDDEYAIIGSANLNRRSLTHDSEVVAGIFDTAEDSMAKRLRIELWAKHLAVLPSALTDAVASARYWYAAPRGQRPAAARVADYDENLNVEPNHPQRTWDQIDPDGS